MGIFTTSMVIKVVSYSGLYSWEPQDNSVGALTEARFKDIDMADIFTMFSFDLSAARSSQLTADINNLTLPTGSLSNKLTELDNIVIPTLTHERISDNYIGRLSIPALGIEDSLYWTGDDFLLRRDYRGRDSVAGELYLDGRSPGNLFRLDNLINGHNMQNGTKFGRLKNVLMHEGPVHVFIKEHLTNRMFIYELFAAHRVHSNNTGVHLRFSSTFARNFYYQRVVENSLIATTITDFSSPILTLNTCDNTLVDGHFLVFAILVEWR